MKVGPNNEIYLDGNNTSGTIAFFITPIADYPDGAKTLEIGAHRKADSYFEDNGDAYMTYGSTASDIVDGTNTYEIASGTEMYYTIDVSNLTIDNGKYLVMIGTNGSDNYGTTLALTSIKVAGYDISFAESEIQAAAETGDILSCNMVNEVATVYALRKAVVEEEVEIIPVNENLSINSAALKASKVVSGKVATLTVKAGTDASTLVVTGPDGNPVEFTRLTSKVSNGVKVFNAIWKVTGSRGDQLDYSIRVFDEDGLASVNTESVTVTIK